MARVFLCDDSEAFRMLARLNLEARGHEVVGECGVPEQCRTLLEAAQPDVALVDGFLPPDITLAGLRENLPATRFVLYPGMPDGPLVDEAARAGADAAISKSASFDEVSGLVRQISA
jgi:DNA-binding NarL/FixJ family response regulator